jgi:hypothetical protein
MASRTFSDHHRDQSGPHKARLHLDDNLRGILIVVVGSLALVGVAYGVMVTLTGPDGWATRMASSAVAGDATLTSYGSEAQQ